MGFFVIQISQGGRQDECSRCDFVGAVGGRGLGYGVGRGRVVACALPHEEGCQTHGNQGDHNTQRKSQDVGQRLYAIILQGFQLGR